ncbi:hypothetical protein [Natrinema sp. J7-1]|uniref:hypothetical protein n=1 Tax=Natrinema sp. J7-1 TaxID=1172566 RepID=UPI000677EDCB|nr:hypothetical protein [Natrinema sp. J7-1]
MYRYTPDEIDQERAHHQALKQVTETNAGDVDVKRIGNLGEMAFERFCREFIPVEMWDWENEYAMRRCNPESFSGYDFEVFGYEVDVKTSRDVSAFLPERMLETDDQDDIIVMAWHRDNEDALILLGWERVETLKSKAETQEEYSGDEPDKLDHLAARPMNELIELGPSTAQMKQNPKNPFTPGDRVVKGEEEDSDPAVVIERLPPEKLSYEAVNVAFVPQLDEGPGDWREIHPAKLASYCDDQNIRTYPYKYSNLELAKNPFEPGDRVVKTEDEDPNTGLVTERLDPEERGYEAVNVVFVEQLTENGSDWKQTPVRELADYCSEEGVRTYPFKYTNIEFAE